MKIIQYKRASRVPYKNGVARPRKGVEPVSMNIVMNLKRSKQRITVLNSNHSSMLLLVKDDDLWTFVGTFRERLDRSGGDE